MNEEDRTGVAAALAVSRKALRETISRTKHQSHRHIAEAYLNFAEAAETRMLSADDWFDRIDDAGLIRALGESVKRAQVAGDWVGVVRHSFGMLQALPGEPGWKPRQLPPPP